MVKKRIIRLLYLVSFIALFLFCTAYYFIFWPNTSVKDEGIMYIYDHNSFEDVLDTLKNRGYLKNVYTFKRVAAMKKYPSLIKSGCYLIQDKMNNNSLVNILRAGRQHPVRFTFNNIRKLDQLASLLSEETEIDSSDFMELVNNPEYVEAFGFTKDNFPGMFIPNTYQLYWDVTADEFIKRMSFEYRKFWNENRLLKAKQAGLTPIEVVTLASIVEEETAKSKEHPVIAGVYINRLHKKIPLAACPTLKYALNDFSIQRVLKRHTKIESPYNTYKYRGLPPGPVRMPSINVVDAVLNYTKHDYIYFCAKSDFSGEHYFSKTLTQHNEYAKEYHQALNERKIY